MTSKDKEKITQIEQTIFEIKDSILPSDKRIYFPNWDNSPPEQESIIKFNGTHLLSKGGLMCLCAKAGVGKSSLTEAFVSSHLNDKSDSLAVKVYLNPKRNKVLICDTERSAWESHKAWFKLMKRAKIKKGSNIDKKVIFANLKALSVDEKKDFVKNIMEENNDIGLIIFDGSSDFIYNTNDQVESNKFIEWLNTFNPNIALICTIHTNPNDNKPRGHLGSELLRKCESVLLAKKEGELYTLTTDFEDYGKNRHGKHQSVNYKYSDEEDMFIVTDEKPTKTKPIVNEKYKQMANDIFGENEHLKFGEIVNSIAKITSKEYDKSKSIFFDNFKNKICEKVEINDTPFWKIIR